MERSPLAAEIGRVLAADRGRVVEWANPQLSAVFIAYGTAQIAQGFRIDLALRRHHQQQQGTTIRFAHDIILGHVQDGNNVARARAGGGGLPGWTAPGPGSRLRRSWGALRWHGETLVFPSGVENV